MRPLADSSGPLIYAITDGNATSENFSTAIEKISRQITEAVDENVSMIQIREKRLSGRHLFELSSLCARITRGSSTKLLINDRIDIAVAAGADGVHQTATSIPASVVRRAFGTEPIIGVSVHTADEAEAASRDGGDFVVFGPVYETFEKGPAVGIDELKRVCSAVAPFPVIGLGGVDPSNCVDVIRAGAAGVAGIRSFGNWSAIRSIRDSLVHG